MIALEKYQFDRLPNSLFLFCTVHHAIIPTKCIEDLSDSYSSSLEEPLYFQIFCSVIPLQVQRAGLPISYCLVDRYTE